MTQVKMKEVDKWDSILKPVLSDFSQEFWQAVQTKFNDSQNSVQPLSWRRSMDEVRVDMLVEKELPDEQDPLFFLLSHAPHHYQQQVDRLATVFFERDKSTMYYANFDDESTYKTLLHVAAERNLVFIAKLLMKYYPDSNLLFISCPYKMKNGKQTECMPLLLALDHRHDGVASYLIKEIVARSHPERVRAIFQPKDDSSKPLLKFAGLIKDKRMQNTVVEVLNCLVKPDWPYLPELDEANTTFEEERNKAWTCVTDDPTKYHFYYQLIDGDQCGRPLKILKKDDFWKRSLESYEDKEKYPCAPCSIDGKRNSHCKVWEKSCLQLLAESNNKRAIQHPVVRNLVRRKWSLYGKKYVSFYAGLYLGFLFCLSFALWQAATVPDPLKYSDDAAEVVRMISEGLVVVILVFYVFEELYQLLRDRGAYWSDKYNFFDIFGLLFLFAVILLRIIELREQWVVASIAYTLNVLRIFKFSCLFESTAVYTNTLAIAISKVIPRFLAVFVVILVALCGSYYFALQWENGTKGVGHFLDVLVIGLRTLTEQEGFYDTHTKWFSLVIGQVFTFTIIVIMLNLLIAQLNDAYVSANRYAHVQTDIDRILVITRLEHSWIDKFNRRLHHYMPGDWSYDVNHVKELIKDWEDEGSDEKIDYIRDFLRETEKRSTVGNLTTPKLREILKDLMAKIGQPDKHSSSV